MRNMTWVVTLLPPTQSKNHNSLASQQLLISLLPPSTSNHTVSSSQMTSQRMHRRYLSLLHPLVFTSPPSQYCTPFFLSFCFCFCFCFFPFSHFLQVIQFLDLTVVGNINKRFDMVFVVSRKSNVCQGKRMKAREREWRQWDETNWSSLLFLFFFLFFRQLETLVLSRLRSHSNRLLHTKTSPSL